jgi:hypothetical protein
VATLNTQAATTSASTEIAGFVADSSGVMSGVNRSSRALWGNGLWIPICYEAKNAGALRFRNGRLYTVSGPQLITRQNLNEALVSFGVRNSERWIAGYGQTSLIKVECVA